MLMKALLSFSYPYESFTSVHSVTYYLSSYCQLIQSSVEQQITPENFYCFWISHDVSSSARFKHIYLPIESHFLLFIWLQLFCS
jgi:hypothetical protein